VFDIRPFLFAEDGYDVFDIDDKKAIVAFKIHRDGSFGIEKDFVILLKGDIGGHFHFCGDGYNPACNGRDFDIVGQLDAAFGLFFVLIFSNEHPFADGLDGFERFIPREIFFVHGFCPV